MLEFRVVAGRKVYSRHHLGPVAAARARKLALAHPRIRFHVEARTSKGWRRMPAERVKERRQSRPRIRGRRGRRLRAREVV